MEDQKDINWSVDFEVTIDGVECRFEDELGFIAYWRAVHRAAFHASACVLSNRGEEFYFDCHKFFKEK